MTTTPITITQELSHWLDLVLREDEFISISIPLAEQIAYVYDPNELLTHVQFYSEPPWEKPFTQPQLWRIKRWKLTSAERERRLIESRLRNSSLSKLHEAIKNVAKKLQSITRQDDKTCISLAKEMVLRGDHESLKAFGITIPERTPEEIAALDRTTLSIL